MRVRSTFRRKNLKQATVRTTEIMIMVMKMPIVSTLHHPYVRKQSNKLFRLCNDGGRVSMMKKASPSVFIFANVHCCIWFPFIRTIKVSRTRIICVSSVAVEDFAEGREVYRLTTKIIKYHNVQAFVQVEFARFMQDAKAICFRGGYEKVSVHYSSEKLCSSPFQNFIKLLVKFPIHAPLQQRVYQFNCESTYLQSTFHYW